MKSNSASEFVPPTHGHHLAQQVAPDLRLEFRICAVRDNIADHHAGRKPRQYFCDILQLLYRTHNLLVSQQLLQTLVLMGNWSRPEIKNFIDP